jgi:hypothetical protein
MWSVLRIFVLFLFDFNFFIYYLYPHYRWISCGVCCGLSCYFYFYFIFNILFIFILQVDFMWSVLRFIYFLILLISILQVDFMWSVLRFIVIVAVPYLVVRTLMEGIDSLNATRFAQGYVCVCVGVGVAPWAGVGRVA